MTRINHIAFLAGSAGASAEVLRRNGIRSGPLQDFEGERTREIYAGGVELSSRLLLMQAIGEGPYKRTLAKRGPGPAVLHFPGGLTIPFPDLLSWLRAALPRLFPYDSAAVGH